MNEERKTINPPRLALGKARALAEKVMDILSPACERIEVAGSVRRGIAEVGDLDIVAMPHDGGMEELRRLFFECAMPGYVTLDGQRAKRCLLRKCGVQLDLFQNKSV